VKAQVLQSFIYMLDRSAMRNVRLLLISLALLSSFGIVMGGEALATIQIPNMTQTEPPSGFAPIQNVSSTTPASLEQLAMSARFVLNDTGPYLMTGFGLNLSPNSQLCPENDCQYGFRNGVLRPNTSTGGYTLDGILEVSTEGTEGISSKLYNVSGGFNVVERLRESEKLTNYLAGDLKIGTGTGSPGGDFDYRVTNGSLAFTSRGADLILLGERSPTTNVQLQQQQSSNMTTLPGQQPSNMTTLPGQQPSNMTMLQQPMIQQTPSQSPLSQLQQPTTTSPTASQTIPQQQQFFPSSPFTSTTGTAQPQASYFPPSSTAYPSTIYPPSGTTFPSTVYPPAGTFPGTGFPMAAAGGMGGVSTPQIIAPWFPSLPATNCGGTFVMTVEGVPEGNNGNSDDRITPSSGGDNNDDSDSDDDKQYSGKSNRRLAVQINSDNSQIITDQQDAIFGQLFQGQKNIDQNKANDFDIRSIFNDCQVSTYSKLG
jgi:hypothetical protein